MRTLLYMHSVQAVECLFYFPYPFLFVTGSFEQSTNTTKIFFTKLLKKSNNKIWKKVSDLPTGEITHELVAVNNAIMMYSPLIDSKK